MFAPAKVNLFLHVGPAKPNGRHDLDSLVVFADARCADELTIQPAKTDSFAVNGPTAGADLAGPDNLVLRALKSCRELGVMIPALDITLTKRLPVAAGIGGGSADAGAMLRWLETMTDLTEVQAMEIARTLGGDVPAAFLSRATMMRGEGERVDVVNDLPTLHALMVNDRSPCPTGPVFQAFDGLAATPPLSPLTLPTFSTASHLIDWLSTTSNDLEAPAISRVPAIREVLSEIGHLKGVRLPRMSGSGATCFGLFDSAAEAIDGQAEITRAHPDWWACVTEFGREI